MYVTMRASLITGNVLEVGSFGSGTMRHIAEPHAKSYMGIDTHPGYNVNRTCDIRELVNECRTYDTVFCMEVLEHAKYFWELLHNIGEALSPHGLLFLSARGATRDGRSTFEHNFNGEPVTGDRQDGDYWRFMPQVVPHLFEIADCDVVNWEQDRQMPGFIGYGHKKGSKIAKAPLETERISASFSPLISR